MDARVIAEIRQKAKVPVQVVGEAVARPNVEIVLPGRPFVPVFVGDHGPFWFLIETGQGAYWVSETVASDLGLALDAEGRTTLPSLTIGHLRWPNIVFSVGDATDMSRVCGRRVDGQLGNWFWIIQDCVVTIDYGRCELLLSAGSLGGQRPSMSDEVFYEAPMELRNTYPLLPVRVQKAGPFRFFLDTGASMCVVSPKVAAEHDLPKGETSVARGPRDDLPCTEHASCPWTSPEQKPRT